MISCKAREVVGVLLKSDEPIAQAWLTAGRLEQILKAAGVDAVQSHAHSQTLVIVEVEAGHDLGDLRELVNGHARRWIWCRWIGLRSDDS